MFLANCWGGVLWGAVAGTHANERGLPNVGDTGLSGRQQKVSPTKTVTLQMLMLMRQGGAIGRGFLAQGWQSQAA